MQGGPYRTDLRLWAISSACLFLAFGFVDPGAGLAKGDNSWWDQLGILLRREYSCSTSEALAVVGIGAVFRAVPSLVLGWVVQALLVVAWYAARRSTGERDINPASEGRPRDCGSRD